MFEFKILPSLPTASTVGCSRCPDLVQSRIQIVDGSGPQRPKLLVVGEAPGGEEDLCGQPFVGKSGQLIRSSLGALGIAEDEIRYTNTVRCHPDQNRDPSASETVACLDWLTWEIADTEPRAILALGRVAKTVLNGDMYKWIHPVSGKSGVCPIFQAWHPAYVLRSPTQRQKWLKQLEPAVTYARTGQHTVSASRVAEPWQVSQVDPTSPWLAFDTETDDLEEGLGVKLVTVQMSDGVNADWWSNVNPMSTFRRRDIYPHVWLHNAKYDAPLINVDLRDPAQWDDTALIAYVLRYPRVGLKTLGPELTGLEMTPIKDILQRREPRLLKSGKQATVKGQPAFRTVKQSFSEALAHDFDRARTYALLDPVVTSRLAARLWPELQKEPRLLAYYQEIEKPTVPILQEMEARGVLVDEGRLLMLRSEIESRLSQYEDMARLTLGVDDDFNLASNDQLADALIKNGFRLTDRTATGKLSVAESTLLRLVHKNTEQEVQDAIDEQPTPALVLVRDLLKTRELKKLKSTYVDEFLEHHDANWRIHARFNQMVTNTNRLSSSGPNLQNIPGRDPLGKTIRNTFRARPGHVILRADLSQAEIRVYADRSGEQVLVDAYTHTSHDTSGPGGECLRCDVHQQLATALGIPRKRAKNGFFSKLYGASDLKFAATCGVNPADAASFLGMVARELPTILTAQDRVAAEMDQKGYIETGLGWRGYFPNYFSPMPRDRAEALREMANFPIQGTVSGLVKQLMIRADQTAPSYGAELVLQVHDEIVEEVPRGLAKSRAEHLIHLAQGVGHQHLTQVPLVLNVEIGESWGEVTDWEQWTP